MFAARATWDLADNAWAARVAARRRAGAPLLDLTDSNPTRCGFDYGRAGWGALADPAGRAYRPDAQGLLPARAAVAAYYATHRVPVDPASVVLTASTSEAYSFLFKLLADPGDAVLAPLPSYPLFDYLAQLDGVQLLPYPLRYDGAWYLDLPALAAACTPRTRAVIAVHPHNPTGMYLSRTERDALVAFCRARRLALIVDEVFLDYAYGPDADRAPSFAGTQEVLTATLSGLSKLAGLPQLKLSWIVVSGPPDLQAAALARLDVIGDTYLSVGTPVQLALPNLLRAGRRTRTQIRARIVANRAVLEGALAAEGLARVLAAGGGWYAVVQVPAVIAEDAWALTLLEADDVLVHPGYFFDFPAGCHLVVSLLPEPAVFAAGAARLARRVAAVAGGDAVPAPGDASERRG